MKRSSPDERNSVIRSSIRLHISLNKQNEALDMLEPIQQQILSDPGCLSARIYREINAADGLLIEELWEDDRSLNLHLKSDEYRRILLAIEMADAPPEIRFQKIFQTNGIEIIEQARRTV